MTREPTCGSCGEPWHPGEPQRFCVTCDAWLHLDCLTRHAPVEPDGEGDWRHAADPSATGAAVVAEAHAARRRRGDDTP